MRFTERKIKQDTQKLKELIIYVSQECSEPRLFGMTKLNKILFAIDFDSYDKLGQPVTGAEYRKGEHGPYSAPLKPLLEKMDGKELTIKTEKVHGKVQQRPVPKRDPDLFLFSEEELKIIDKWINAMKDKTAKFVRAWSHTFVGWKSVEQGEHIPYHSIYWGHVRGKPITEEEIKRAKEAIGHLDS